jgi:hypothetical protein
MLSGSAATDWNAKMRVHVNAQESLAGFTRALENEILKICASVPLSCVASSVREVSTALQLLGLLAPAALQAMPVVAGAAACWHLGADW